jgi:hypothetical protein
MASAEYLGSRLIENMNIGQELTSKLPVHTLVLNNGK